MKTMIIAAAALLTVASVATAQTHAAPHAVTKTETTKVAVVAPAAEVSGAVVASTTEVKTETKVEVKKHEAKK